MTEFPVSITFQGKLEKIDAQRAGSTAAARALICRTSGSNINLKKTPATVGMFIHGQEKTACVN